MSDFLIAGTAIAGTILIYAVGVVIHKKVKSPFTLPILIATFIIIALLLVFKIPYALYMTGGDLISKLLGPAVVALAYPLYQHRSTLRKLAMPVIIGTLIGALTGVTSGILLAKAAGIEHVIILSLTSKSVTTPVAMAITDNLGGEQSLAAVFVMIAGIGGVLIRPYVYRLFKLNHYIGRGVGVGSASHAIGTASAMEDDQLEGSVSTIAMIVSAMLVSVITPLIVQVLL